MPKSRTPQFDPEDEPLEKWESKMMKKGEEYMSNTEDKAGKLTAYYPYSQDVKWYINYFGQIPEIMFDFYYEGSNYIIDIDRVDKWLSGSELVEFKMLNKTAYDIKRNQYDIEELSYFYVLKDKVMIRIQQDKLIIIAPTEDNKVYKKVFDFIRKSFRRMKLDKEFFILNFKNNHFSLKSIKIKPVDLDLKKNYNDDFMEFDKDLVSNLENEKSGIILLHGEPGTGKTTYLKKLIIDVDKKFIYINPNLVPNLLSPDFIDFIAQNNNSILIIEEAEKIIKDRINFDSNQASVSNLLNISDGLLSDALQMKIICTFNADIKDIDKALLRKGRIMSKYEFKALEKNKAQEIITELYPEDNIVVDKAMTIAEIYNFDKKDYQVRYNSVGFKR
jgi:broad-specificity NMP kinase